MSSQPTDSTRTEPASDPILQVDDVTKSYQSFVAVDGVSFTVDRGEILAVIGPNGAGKTTLFNLINGFLDSEQGTVSLNGVDVTTEKPYVHNHHGMARTFQHVHPFDDMTVRENIMAGAFTRAGSNAEAETRAAELIEYLDLEGVEDELATTITVRQKKYMELARALATDPEILLVDEIIAGLNDQEMEDMIGILRRINDDGVSIVLVEHVMEAVMSISDRVIVLSAGTLIANGPPEAVVEDPQVVDAYLGEEFREGDGSNA